jgi:hypothetical protein
MPRILTIDTSALPLALRQAIAMGEIVLQPVEDISPTRSLERPPLPILDCADEKSEPELLTKPQFKREQRLRRRDFEERMRAKTKRFKGR